MLGFEAAPIGQLLIQNINLDGPVGVAYERSVGFFKDFHIHDRDILVFPRRACRMLVNTRSAKHPVDGGTGLFIPTGVEHDDHGLSTVYDTIALLPDCKTMHKLATSCQLSANEQTQLRRECFAFKRTRWLNELIERLLYERILAPEPHLDLALLLEQQIILEVLRGRFAPNRAALGQSGHSDSDGIASEARRIIESNLFEDLAQTEICERLDCSASTLLRAFRETFQMTPGAYVKRRRLDEAAVLLRQGHEQVSDVALLVGYEDVSAFIRSFRQQFGTTPRRYRLQAMPLKQPSNS